MAEEEPVRSSKQRPFVLDECVTCCGEMRVRGASYRNLNKSTKVSQATIHHLITKNRSAGRVEHGKWNWWLHAT
jgi:hypothetical protein